MQEIKNRIKNAEIGSIVPIVETLPFALEPVDYFAKLSDYGAKSHCVLLESADIVPKYGEKSLGSADPCLKVIGKGENFEITALNAMGIRFIEFLKGDFDFCDKVAYKKDKIFGKLKPKRGHVSEEERLRLKSHMDIIRKIAFKFKPTEKPFIPYCGLFGSISYEFIDQFEDLPKNSSGLTNDPDYLLYFLDNLFLIDHKQKKTYFISNALITDNSKDKLYSECMSKIKHYRDAINKNGIKKPIGINQKKLKDIKTDTNKEEFIEKVKKIKIT